MVYGNGLPVARALGFSVGEMQANAVLVAAALAMRDKLVDIVEEHDATGEQWRTPDPHIHDRIQEARELLASLPSEAV